MYLCILHSTSRLVNTQRLSRSHAYAHAHEYKKPLRFFDFPTQMRLQTRRSVIHGVQSQNREEPYIHLINYSSLNSSLINLKSEVFVFASSHPPYSSLILVYTTKKERKNHFAYPVFEPYHTYIDITYSTSNVLRIIQ